jgi:hypothetical protein
MLVLILVLAVGSGLGGYFLYPLIPDNNYSLDDILSAYQLGNTNGDKDREYIDSLLDDLRNDLSDNDSPTDFTDLMTVFEGILGNIDGQLSEQGADIEGLTSAKLLSLQSMASALTTLKTSYETELTALNAQLDEINSDIADLGSDFPDELAILIFARDYTVERIGNTENVIEQIDAQLAIIAAQIALLS